ncbi:hypothetical protein EVAR_23302_1 [Eumeta japonica]|uniref:Uncharacterized protein n=1 Tax=Eumeta variegata TaxID=151549 RepID=A0A4C1V887_EUMVA|nr:hypothetical protein EVAR_23302_1 [Eumeta japonica]
MNSLVLSSDHRQSPFKMDRTYNTRVEQKTCASFGPLDCYLYIVTINLVLVGCAEAEPGSRAQRRRCWDHERRGRAAPPEAAIDADLETSELLR